MHPLLLFTLFFIPGINLSSSSSVKKMLEYPPELDSVEHAQSRDYSKVSPDQRNPDIHVSSTGKGQTIIKTFNDGPSSDLQGSVQYVTSFDRNSKKLNPNGYYVQTLSVQSVHEPPSYAKVVVDTKEKKNDDTLKKTVSVIKTSYQLLNEKNQFSDNNQEQIIATGDKTDESNRKKYEHISNIKQSDVSKPLQKEEKTSIESGLNKMNKDIHQNVDDILKYIYGINSDIDKEITDNSIDVDGDKLITEEKIHFENKDKQSLSSNEPSLILKQKENNIGLLKKTSDIISVKDPFPTNYHKNYNLNTPFEHIHDNNKDFKTNDKSIVQSGNQLSHHTEPKDSEIENKHLFDNTKNEIKHDKTPNLNHSYLDRIDENAFVTNIESPLYLNYDDEQIMSPEDRNNFDEKNLNYFFPEENKDHLYDENIDDVNKDNDMIIINDNEHDIEEDLKGDTTHSNKRLTKDKVNHRLSDFSTTTTTTELTPLKRPPVYSEDGERSTESMLMHHDTTENPPKQQNNEYDPSFWDGLSKNFYTGFITKLIDPLINHLRMFL